jgi:murein DD-endopeptidase MepM/ murein hydrolase activator NlpD
MKAVLYILIFCSNLISIAEAQTVKIFYENNNHDFILYCSNNEFSPVSILVNLDLTNLDFSEGGKKIFIIPERNAKFKIGVLTVREKGHATKFSYNFRSALGDVTLSKYDTLYEYDLPFKNGGEYKVHQGYNGAFSHQNEYAIDFTMPEGTEILAARDGKIIQVVQNNTESCPEEKCKKYNNFILIMHADGTFASYYHIKYNGSVVKVGDSVSKGTVIAYSGNVGWSSGPHLHFACFMGAFEKPKTIRTKFRIDTGKTVIELLEGSNYSRSY